MKKIVLAFTLSVLALAGCSSEAPVDTGSADTQTQADALHSKAVELASKVTFEQDGTPIVPADWKKYDRSGQPMDGVAPVDGESAKMNTDDKPWMARADRAEADLPGDGKPNNEMRNSCYNTGSYISCCSPTTGLCCLTFPNYIYCIYQ